MPDIPIRIFKGLYTNVDKTDVQESYFPEYRNIRTRPGYIESSGLGFITEDLGLEEGETLVTERFVLLDDDKYQNEYDKEKNTLTNTYKQNIQKYLFRITYKLTSYYFKLKLINGNNNDWIGIAGTMSPFQDTAGQNPIIVNEDGVLKVLFDKKALWIGKINRYYWTFEDTPAHIGDAAVIEEVPLLPAASSASIAGGSLPDPPPYLSPPDYSWNLPMPVLFHWSYYTAFEGILEYRFQISTLSANNFDAGIIYDEYIQPALPGNDGSKLIDDTNLLKDNVSYYWRVFARNEIGWSVASKVLSFSVMPSIVVSIDPPVLYLPLNNSIFSYSPVQNTTDFIWYGVPDNEGYYLQIATDSGFTELVKEERIPAGLIYWRLSLEIDKTYYWRMATIGNGVVSIWSEVFTFSIDYKEPEVIPDAQFFAFPLVEELQKNPLAGLFDFTVEHEKDDNKIEVTAEIKSWDYQLNYRGYIFETVAIEFRDVLTKQPIYYSADGEGLLHLFKHPIFSGSDTEYLLSVNHLEYFQPAPDSRSIDYGFTTFRLIENEILTSDIFKAISFYIFYENESKSYITDYFSQTFILDLTKVSFELAGTPFSSGQNIQLLTTIVTNNNEFPVEFKDIGDSSEEFVIKAIPNSAMISGLYRNKTSANIYMRYSNSIIEETEKDFELCYSIQFVTGNPGYPVYLINSITPKGIFLTQMIGKFFEPDTYKIISAFNDLKTVAGVSYILKNGNVHYPAVGAGMILQNTFYEENAVPSIEGQLLVNISNSLGVFSQYKELLTLLDFQPVEGAMLFYVKDTIGYKVRDEKDIIETADGLFLHLKEGIFVVNGTQRVLLSMEINDIVRDNYETGNIYYNSYEKELYYLNARGAYVYYFDMRSWSQIDLPEFTSQSYNAGEIIKYIRVNDTAEEIIDVIDDYAGSMYFITASGRYKLVRINAIGKIKSILYGADGLTVAKRINHLTFDFEGRVKYDKKEKVGFSRKQLEFHHRLEERKPKRLQQIEFEFENKVYNLEINLDIFPMMEK